MKPKSKVVKRSGTAKRMPTPHYPKRYEVVITENPDGSVLISRSTQNMSSWELYGVLRMLLMEIERQMMIKPDDELKVE